MTSKEDAAKRNYQLALFLSSICIFIFYTICITPMLGWRDGPELVVTATYLDIAHPAGFPTYSLFANLFTFLPFASIGFRVSLFSAFMAATTFYLMGLFVYRIHRKSQRISAAPYYLLAPLVVFALTSSVFNSAIEVEVYSLNMAFIVLLLCCALLWFLGKGTQWLYLGGFIYGLASGNHASVALYLPVLLLLTFMGEPKEAKDNKNGPLKRILILMLLFLVGLSVYLMLPIRSYTGPPIDFGHTHNWERFYEHISDKKDADIHFLSFLNFSVFWEQLKLYLNTAWDSIFIFLGLPFFCLGLLVLWRKYQIISVAIPLLIIINISFFLYWIDGTSAFLPSYVVAFLVITLGYGFLGDLLIRKKVSSWLASIILITISLPIIFHYGAKAWKEREIDAGYQSVELSLDDMVNMDPDALNFSQNFWFIDKALSTIYGLRPDITVINYSSLIAPKFFDQITAKRFPRIIIPQSNLGGDLSYEDLNYDFAVINENFAAGYPIYFDIFSKKFKNNVDNTIVPVESLKWHFKYDPISGQDKELVAKKFSLYIKKMHKQIEADISNEITPLAKKKLSYYLYTLSSIVDMLIVNKESSELKIFLDYLYDQFKIGAPLHSYISNEAYSMLLSMRMILSFSEDSPERTLELLKLKINFEAAGKDWYFMSLLYIKLNRLQDALFALEKAIEFEPYNIIWNNEYANIYAEYFSLKEAVQMLNKKKEAAAKDGAQNYVGFANELINFFELPPEEPFTESYNVFLEMLEQQKHVVLKEANQ